MTVGGEREVIRDPPVAVFDLDGTLLRGDSFARFLTRMLLRRPGRAAAAAVSSPALAVMLLLPRARRRAIVVLLWLATLGLDAETFGARMAVFAAGHAAGPNQIAVALDRLRAHRDAGHRIVIATGCPVPMAQALCRALGLDTVEILGARLDPGAGRLRLLAQCRMWNALPLATGRFSFGAEKVRRLAGHGVGLPVAYAYTNSVSDLPLLLVAQQRFLVDPARGHVRRARGRTGPGCAVLRSVGPGAPRGVSGPPG